MIQLDEAALERQARLSVIRSLIFYGAILVLDLLAVVYIAAIAGPPPPETPGVPSPTTVVMIPCGSI